MPELPEVETMVRGVRPHVEGRRLHAVRRCRCAYRPISISPTIRAIQQRVANARVGRVVRIAKRVVLELTTGDCFVIEPRMTGLMLLDDPPDRGHLRMQWEFVTDQRRYTSLWFWDRRGLGTVRLYSPQQMQERVCGQLGPDALTMTEHIWRSRCGRTGRAIKIAMLDQRFAAGIGNLYASEILHAARISPLLPADCLDRPQLARLNAATHKILEAAIRYEGSTLNDGTYRNALNQQGGYQNEHRVYARAGERCLRCRRGIVRRIVQAQRSTFYCPVCQRVPRGRRR